MLCVLTLPFASIAAQNVSTQQYSNQRAGYQAQETHLTPANVSSGTFGKLFSLPVSGHVFAEPLFMSGIKMGDGLIHNVLFVATEQDFVYAFDADGKNPAAGYLWRVNLAPTGETFLSHNDVHSGEIYPDVGITSTPVIDPASATLYVVAKTKTTATTALFHHRLHALSLANGSEKLNGPTLIQASVPGTGDGGTVITFNDVLQNQRVGLLLTATPNGASPASVFIAWASHGDQGAYHGWVISYNSADISKQTGAWVDTPNGNKGGIWLAGGALSSDDTGDIYVGDGNGDFNASTYGGDYGDSAVALTLNGTSLVPSSYFTPGDQNTLDVNDYDMASGALVLLPTQTGLHPHLLVTTDKTGTLYLIDRDKLGGYTTPENANVQSFNIGYSIVSSVAFYNNTLYLAGEGGPLASYAFNPTTGLFNTSATSTSAVTYGCNDCGGGGAIPVISANGTTNAIVWTLDNSGRENSPGILRANDPANLKTVLFDSSATPNNRDAAAVAVKFTHPVVTNGYVYVPGVNAITAYGLLGARPSIGISAKPSRITPGTSTTLSVSAENAKKVVITGSDGSKYSLSAAGGTKKVTPKKTTTYTVTATGTAGAATDSALVTVESAKTCLPNGPGVSICSPADNSTTTSSVLLTVGATAQSGNIASMRAYIDSVLVLNVKNPTASKSMQTSLTVNVTPGGHGLAVFGYQSTGGSVEDVSGFTVTSGAVRAP